MFCWRNILSAIFWVCCCNPLFAQEIDYSKCSCDSIARYFTTRLSNSESHSNSPLKDTTLKNFIGGFEREIEIGKINWYWDSKSKISYGLKKCIYRNEKDSIVVKYSVDNIIQAQGANNIFHFGKKYLSYYYHDEHIVDPEKKGRDIRYINFKTDSLIYTDNKNSYYIFSYFPFSDSVKNDYQFNLIHVKYKNISGVDSVIYRYYLPDELFYYGLTKNEITKIKRNYKPILFAKYEGPIDKMDELHGKYSAYDYKGNKFMEINYRKGLKHGKYFYMQQVWSGQKGNYDKGQFIDGKKSGTWLYKRGSSFSKFPKKYKIKYDYNGKPKNITISKNDKQAIKRPELNDSGDIYEYEPILFNIYGHFLGTGY